MGTNTAYWQSRMPLLGLMDARANENPTATLVTCFDGSLSRCATVAYRNALSRCLASDWNVRNGDRVILVESSSKYFVVALSAIAAAGAIAIPIGSTWEKSSLEHIESSTTPKLVITFQDSPGVALSEKHFLLDEESANSAVLKFGAVPLPALAVETAASPLFLLFTTGTTGQPKGVVISHQAHLAAVESISEYLKYPNGSRILLALSPSFDYGLYQYFLAIHSGSELVVARRPCFPLDLLDLIAKNSISIVPLVPSQWRALANADLSGGNSLPQICIATSTGSSIDAKLMQAITKLLPCALFYSMYGLTECKRISFLNPDLARLKPTSVGKPMPNCSIRILDSQSRPVEFGQIGELVVRGPNVASGYWMQISDPSSPFKRDPLSGELELRTGDYFRQDEEGDLFFCGRQDDLVKAHDTRISLLDVDHYLLALPMVRDAVAFMHSGTQGPRLAAKVVLKPSSLLADLRPSLIRRGTPLHFIPQDIEEVAAIPLNANGKPVRE